MPQVLPRHPKQGDIQQQVQDTRKVKAHVQAQLLGGHGADELAETQQTAGV